MRKLICHAEFIIGENATSEQLERILDKGFDHALYLMTDGIDIKLDSDMIYTKSIYDVIELSKMTFEELKEVAENAFDIKPKSTQKQALIYEILEAQMIQNGK